MVVSAGISSDGREKLGLFGLKKVQHTGDVLFRVPPLCLGRLRPSYAFSNLGHFTRPSLAINAAINKQSTGTQHSACRPQRHKHPQSTRQRSQETAINEQMERKKQQSTKLIYPLENNFEFRYMLPKGIYYFNTPPWFDDVHISLLEPRCIPKSEGRKPASIINCVCCFGVLFAL